MATPSYRFTEWQSDAGEIIGVELYNLQCDPQNPVNLAVRGCYADVVKQLSAQLNANFR